MPVFEVIWTTAASEALEGIWQRVRDRDAVLRSVWHIEDELKRDPENAGESREDEQRVTYDGPLGVLFEAFSSDRTVWIQSVWLIRQV